MKFSVRQILFVSIFVILAIGIAVFNRNSTDNVQHSKAIYYCPMHPTYTSNKPGDCPICNMKLVKKENSSAMSSQEKVAQQLKDICIMHNCGKAHDGKPCPMLVVGKEGESVDCPVCGKHIIEGGKVKKILYWTDPMIPGYKSDRPGKSPMGMDLVPVYEEETSSSSLSQAPEGYAQVLLSPQKQQLIGVKTTSVERRKLTKAIRTVGTIAHDPELYQAQAEYIQAIQAYERSKESNILEIVDQSKRLLESTKIRLKHMGLSDDLIDDMAAWKEPEHGLLFAHPGEPVWMYAQIYEYELPLVHVGQKLRVDVPSLPDEMFEGTLRAIDPMVVAATRTTRIRAQVEDLKGLLKPDMYVNVTIDIDLGETLAIPQEAVFNTGTKQIVFISKGEGLFEPRDVKIGVKAEGFFELKGGVSEGEEVVTSGNFLIDSESRLKAALEGMTGGGGHQHGQ